MTTAVCIYIYIYMYDVLSSHIARVRINRVRLPILLVISLIGKMNSSLSPFAPENLVSRDGFGSPVPRQPAHLHTQAKSGTYFTVFLPIVVSLLDGVWNNGTARADVHRCSAFVFKIINSNKQ